MKGGFSSLFLAIFEAIREVSRIFRISLVAGLKNIEFPFILLAIYFYPCLRALYFQLFPTSKLIQLKISYLFKAVTNRYKILDSLCTKKEKDSIIEKNVTGNCLVSPQILLQSEYLNLPLLAEIHEYGEMTHEIFQKTKEQDENEKKHPL